MLYSKTNRRTRTRKEEKEMLLGTLLFIGLSLLVSLFIMAGLIS
jgi:hypothetical protein